MNMFWGQESLTLANDPDLALEQILSTWQSWCRRAWAIISCLCSGFRSQVDLSSNPGPSTAQACWLGHHQIAIQVPFLEPLLLPPFLTVLSKPQFRLCQCQTRRETNITNKMVKFSKTLFIIYFSGRCLSLWMKLIIYSHIGERFIRYTNRPFSNLAYSVCKGKEVWVFFFYTSKHREWLLLNQRESSVNVLCYLCKLPSKKQGLPLLLYTESIIFLEV